MAGGIALLDYNGDGLVDIFVVNGAKMPSLQKDGPRYYNRLFRNDGNLKFTDVTAQAHVEGTGYGIGVAVGDYDNDGRPDIFVANVNGNQLLHNNGDGTFTDVTEKAGVSGVMHNGSKMWAVSAAWLDYNNDGLLDLFVSNYCEWDPLTEHACKLNGERAYCDPIYYKPLPNTETMEMARSPMFRRKREYPGIWDATWVSRLQTTTATDGRTSLSPVTRRQTFYSITSKGSGLRRLASISSLRIPRMA
jgi:hypothetical protein